MLVLLYAGSWTHLSFLAVLTGDMLHNISVSIAHTSLYGPGFLPNRTHGPLLRSYSAGFKRF